MDAPEVALLRRLLDNGAYTEVEAACRARPADDADAQTLLGLALRGQGRLDESLSVLLGQPDNVQAIYEAANTMIIMGRVDEAIGLRDANWPAIWKDMHVPLAAGGLHRSDRFMAGTFWGHDAERVAALHDAAERFDPVRAKFVGGYLVSFLKNMHFLRDPDLRRARGGADLLNATRADEAWDSGNPDQVGGFMWSVHMQTALAQQALSNDGDFVECGTYNGGSAVTICRFLDWAAVPKTFHLFDLFEWSEGDRHSQLEGHNDGLFERVTGLFAPYPNVRIHRGRVPESLVAAPERIAFLHVDMNEPHAELGAYHALWDRIVTGGIILLDDYGWDGRQDQCVVANAFFASKGKKVVELPTGQGLVIK